MLVEQVKKKNNNKRNIYSNFTIIFKLELQ